jgi:hypothetical protein
MYVTPAVPVYRSCPSVRALRAATMAATLLPAIITPMAAGLFVFKSFSAAAIVASVTGR